jgi:hypothetical protein
MKTLKINYKIQEISCNETIITLRGDDGSCNDIEIFWKYTGEIVPKANSMNGDFSLVSILPYAMRNQLNISLEGRAGKELVAALEECQDLWVLWRPDLYSRIRITCNEMEAPEIRPGSRAVMAFSGGVDACYSLHAHQSKLLGQRSKEIELALLIVGFDLDRNNPDWIRIAINANRKILDSYGVKQTIVETNWKEYCIDWEMAFGFGVTATLHHFNKTYQCGIWSADEDYRSEVRPWGNHSSQNSLLSERSFPLYATGAGLDRSSKVKVIASNKVIVDNIRVCWAFPTGLLNCGKCEKCVRTYLNFKIAGVEKVDAISSELKTQDISRIKIKSDPVKTFYSEILLNSANLDPAHRRAIKHVLRMSRFYIRLKRFFDKNLKIKKFIMSRINPRTHY